MLLRAPSPPLSRHPGIGVPLIGPTLAAPLLVLLVQHRPGLVATALLPGSAQTPAGVTPSPSIVWEVVALLGALPPILLTQLPLLWCCPSC